MNRKILGFIGAVLLLGSGEMALAQDESADSYSDYFSATFGITTNFMYRGISFSNDEPTIYGSLDWSYNGWFAGIFGEALGDQDNNGPGVLPGPDPVNYELEIDYYGGYASSAGDLEWFAMLIYLQYINCDKDNVQRFFGSDRPLECDFAELWLDGTYPIGDYITAHLWYAYSPDFEFESGTSHYLWGDVTVQLGESPFQFHAGLGHWDVEGGTYSESFGGTSDEFGWHYINTIYGFSASWAGFDFDLSLHDTNGDGPNDSLRNYIPDPTLTDDEVVFTISRTF